MPLLKKIVLLVATVVVVALLCGVLAKTALTLKRLVAMHKIMSLPGARQRVAMVPTHLFVSEPHALSTPINLGYAVFDLGNVGPVTCARMDTSRNCICVTSPAVRLFFLSPYAPSQIVDAQTQARLSQIQNQQTDTAKEIARTLTNPLETEIRAEERLPVSTWELAWMSGNTYYLYALQMILKADHRFGCNEVIVSHTPHTMGLIHIGESPTDRTRGMAAFSSADDQCQVGCHITITDPQKCDTRQVYESLARSFVFTIPTIPSEDELGKLIEQTGIPTSPP